MEYYPVVIVGAGPAGLSVARDVKLDALVLEEHEGYGNKPCGEMVQASLKGTDFTDFYGSKKGIEKPIDSFRFRFDSFDLGHEHPCYSIDRERFERELANQVTHEIRTGTPVNTLERRNGQIVVNGDIVCDTLVGADGAHSAVRRFLGYPLKEFGVAVQADASGRAEEAEFVFSRGFGSGYGWVFPQKKTLNVGLGMEGGQGLMEKWAGFISNRGLSTGGEKAWTVPSGYPKKTFSKNVMLVGDAASQVNALCGGGIFPSMLCGSLAARTINAGKMPSDYGSLWRRELGTYFERAYYGKKIFYTLHSLGLEHAFRLFGKVFLKVFL